MRSYSAKLISLSLIVLSACFTYPTQAEEINKTTVLSQTSTPQPPKIDVEIRPIYEPNNSDNLSDTDNADSEKSPTPVNEETQNQTWSDTRPEKVSADWLQLTSGEWLRGRIIVMQKDNLEFDSDELNELEIDWEKVRYIKSSEPYSLRFYGSVQATGAIEVTQDIIHVNTDYDDLSFNRNELQSIATGKETEISKWSSKVTFSINVRRGNTKQTDFTSKVTAKRRTVSSRLALDYLGNFTETEETKTVNNHRLNATYDIFITRNLFLTPVTAEFFRDPFQNIEKRNTIGIAAGYTLINTNKTGWDISGGPAYQETKFVSVKAGDDTKDATVTLILGTKFETELNSNVDMQGNYSVTLGDEKTGGYTHHSILTIETEITDKLDFDVSGVWDRVKDPVPGEDGRVPDQNDFRVMIGLGYDL